MNFFACTNWLCFHIPFLDINILLHLGHLCLRSAETLALNRVAAELLCVCGIGRATERGNTIGGATVLGITIGGTTVLGVTIGGATVQNKASPVVPGKGGFSSVSLKREKENHSFRYKISYKA